jgi:hypothetical protein
VKKRSRIEIAREIVASLKKEMQKLRLTESVRNDLGARAAQTVEKPAVGRAQLWLGLCKIHVRLH